MMEEYTRGETRGRGRDNGGVKKPGYVRDHLAELVLALLSWLEKINPVPFPNRKS
jgi:hypothetical protein